MDVLAAEFYPGSATRSPTLDINRIVDGHRTKVISFCVKTKREGRQIAQRYGAQPWNF